MKTFACSSIHDLSAALTDAHQSGRKMPPLDLSPLNRVVAYAPEDMTVTVESGVALSDLQEQLNRHGQWLPLDPRFPESISIERLLSHNLSGPRRHGYGTVREHLIGLQVVLADGRIVRSGGRVVKNVAGYDLAKLFVGARGTLGVPVEATFKLMPQPEQECLVRCHCASLDVARELLEAVLTSDLAPVVMDLHGAGDTGECWLVLGLAGTQAEVDWQREEARKLGIDQPADWSYETDFWKINQDQVPHQWSVLPSRLVEALDQVKNEPWLARAGQGLVLHYGDTPPSPQNLPRQLMHRLKSSFDPHAVLPDLPW